MSDKEKRQLPDQTGDDGSEGDAREEGRMDKDEDLKSGIDEDVPIAKPFTEKAHHVTPHSLSIPDTNHGHPKGKMGEEEEPDPTSDDAPDLQP